MKDKTIRKGTKWAKISGQRGRYIVAFGWAGQFAAVRTQTHSFAMAATIAAQNWIND